MATIRAKLKELRDADVRFISLVDRAASRIPFRVLKRDKESDMLNLKTVFKSDKPAPAPDVAALIVFAQDDPRDASAVRDIMTGAGFTTNRVQKSDGGETLVFVQKDHQTEDTTIIRLSDQILLAVTGMGQPAGLYGQLATTNGFLPGIEMALDTFREDVENITTKSERPQEAIKSAVADLGAYLHLLTSLPASCFKVDKHLQALSKRQAQSQAEDEKEQQNRAANPDKPVFEPNDGGVEEIEAPGMTGNGGSVSTEKTATPETTKTPGQTNVETTVVGDGVSGITKKAGEADKKTDLQQMLDAVSGVSDKIEALSAIQGAQQKVLDAVVQKADDLDKKIAGTVVGAAPAGDRVAEKDTTIKADDDPRSGTFDTAFLRKRRR